MNKIFQNRPGSVISALCFALTVRILITFYWLSRFGGNWVEGDTARTTITIEAVFNSGKLIPLHQRIYPYGFLYQVFGAVLSHISGWSVIDLQNRIVPFLGLLFTLIGFVLYMYVLEKPIPACIATILLNLQGDFILTSLRGSHEKIDYILIGAALITLGLSVSRIRSTRDRIAFAILYYLIIFAESTINVFIASSFIMILIIAYIFWIFLRRYWTELNPEPARLIYIVLMAMIFVFLVIIVVYPPARNVLFNASDIVERVRLLFLSNNEPPADLYEAAAQGWIIPNGWILLRLYDFLLLGSAGIEWALLIWSHRTTKGLRTLPDNFFWLMILFPAFAIQNVVAILLDITGSASDINNLEIRLIPLTSLIAAPMAAKFIIRAGKKLQSLSRLKRQAVSVISTSVLIILLFLSLIKGTSEPLISNIWIFYSPAEDAGLHWLNTYIPRLVLEGGVRFPNVWIGPGSRLGDLWLNNIWGPDINRIPAVTSSTSTYGYVFLSPAVRLATERYHRVLPDLRNLDIIYDNGAVQIYHLPAEAR